jgi:hypothetical protein
MIKFADINDDSEEDGYQPSDDDGAGEPAQEEGVRKKERREAVGTGFALEPPCTNCVKVGRLCQEDTREGACLACFQKKSKCEYSMRGGIKPQKRKITLDELRKVKTEDDGKKSRTKKGKGKRKAAELKEDSQEEEEATRPLPKYVEVSDDPKPKRKRAARKAKPTATAPALDISDLVTVRKCCCWCVVN